MLKRKSPPQMWGLGERKSWGKLVCVELGERSGGCEKYVGAKIAAESTWVRKSWESRHIHNPDSVL